MKSAFPLLPNYIQTLLGSHLADCNQCLFCFAKAPVVAQLSLRIFDAAYFHSDFTAKYRCDLMTYLDSDLYIAT